MLFKLLAIQAIAFSGATVTDAPDFSTDMIDTMRRVTEEAYSQVGPNLNKIYQTMIHSPIGERMTTLGSDMSAMAQKTMATNTPIVMSLGMPVALQLQKLMANVHQQNRILVSRLTELDQNETRARQRAQTDFVRNIGQQMIATMRIDEAAIKMLKDIMVYSCQRLGRQDFAEIVSKNGGMVAEVFQQTRSDLVSIGADEQHQSLTKGDKWVAVTEVSEDDRAWAANNAAHAIGEYREAQTKLTKEIQGLWYSFVDDADDQLQGIPNMKMLSSILKVGMRQTFNIWNGGTGRVYDYYVKKGSKRDLVDKTIGQVARRIA